MVANFWLGFAVAAAEVASARRNPTVMIRSHLSCRKALMLTSSSVTPFQAVWLKDLSSIPPVSVTWQIFTLGTSGVGVALGAQAAKIMDARTSTAKMTYSFFDMRVLLLEKE